MGSQEGIITMRDSLEASTIAKQHGFNQHVTCLSEIYAKLRAGATVQSMKSYAILMEGEVFYALKCVVGEYAIYEGSSGTERKKRLIAQEINPELFYAKYTAFPKGMYVIKDKRRFAIRVESSSDFELLGAEQEVLVFSKLSDL